MRFSLLLICLGGVLIGCTPQNPDVLHQIGPVEYLLQGSYDGQVTIGDAKKLGDFGIGTYHAIEGEMLVLDGVFYQMLADGRVVKASNAQTTPYASVHFFQAESELSLGPLDSFRALQGFLDTKIPKEPYPYGIKIQASIPYIKFRSPQIQSKPYPNLKGVIETQSVFERNNVSGTLVGYYIPPYLGKLTVSGYHFHFISDDLTFGGHLLEVSIQSGTVTLDRLTALKTHIYDPSGTQPKSEVGAEAIFSGKNLD